MADRKMSLNDLSEKVGISNVNLSKLKTGKASAIRFTTLNAICKPSAVSPVIFWNMDRMKKNRLFFPIFFSVFYKDRGGVFPVFPLLYRSYSEK